MPFFFFQINSVVQAFKKLKPNQERRDALSLFNKVGKCLAALTPDSPLPTRVTFARKTETKAAIFTSLSCEERQNLNKESSREIIEETSDAENCDKQEIDLNKRADETTLEDLLEEMLRDSPEKVGKHQAL